MRPMDAIANLPAANSPGRDRHEAIVDAYLEAGLELHTAERLASLTIKLAKQETAGHLESFIDAFRPTQFGTALALELFGEDGESQKAAARRLCTSPAALRKARQRVRKCLDTLRWFPPSGTLESKNESNESNI